MLLFLNVIYVLVAIAMVALILMQRGAGAQAGSGFGGGASATVFGARGGGRWRMSAVLSDSDLDFLCALVLEQSAIVLDRSKA